MIKMQLTELAESPSTPVVAPPPRSCEDIVTESSVAHLVGTIQNLESSLQESKRKASQTAKEHLLLLHNFNLAEGEICKLRQELAQTQGQMAFLESKIPRFLRYFLGL